ncbi:MAG: hypothetical protein HYR55_04410 [Acidobacteria bacterium]|nr:hypothetical protein [Acidobacteriota bacterium]MBI3656312.1 hypothetical protein [Acidobacteriota bacterium]
MRLLLGLVFFATFASPASASLQSQEDVAKWFTYYHQKPNPTKIPDAIKYMSQSGLLDNKNAVSPIFGFLAGGRFCTSVAHFKCSATPTRPTILQGRRYHSTYGSGGETSRDYCKREERAKMWT